MRHYAGPFGNVTATSASSVTLPLDGMVQPNELLLVCVIWEPLALPDTWSNGGNTNQRSIGIDDVLLAGGESIVDRGRRTTVAQVGFMEYPRAEAGRGPTNPYSNYTGLPTYPSWPAAQPSGIAANLRGYWHEDPFDELTFTFLSVGSTITRPQPVDWVRILAWKIAEWGGDPVPKSGTNAVGRPEPAESTYDAVNPTPPPAYTDTWSHACPQGGTYSISDPLSDWISDGGDTERHWTPSTLVPHHIEYGVAGRFGQGTGTFTWDTWTSPILIDTVDRSQPLADAHFEIYVKVVGLHAALNGCGTFGAQTFTQSVGMAAYRGPGLHPVFADSPRTGAMLRGAGIAVATTTGGWMPQIYRRVGAAQ